MKATLVGLVMSLVLASLAACGSLDEEEYLHGVPARPPNDRGMASYQERVLSSDVVVRASLTNAQRNVEAHSSGSYFVAWVYTFTVHEYLKGSGATTLTAIAPQLNPEFTSESAARGNLSSLESRDRQYDDRQAILFLTSDYSAYPSTSQANRYMLGFHALWGSGTYAITSEWGRTWLPDASSGGGIQSGEQYFLLDVSGEMQGSGAVPGGRSDRRLALSALKSAISAMQQEVDSGDGTVEYERCIKAKQFAKRYYAHLDSIGRGTNTTEFDVPSGFASGTVLYSSNRNIGLLPDTYGRHWNEGVDKDYFAFSTEKLGSFALYARDSQPSDAFQYKLTLGTSRPLAAGTYIFHPNGVTAEQIVCTGWESSHLNRMTTTVRVAAPTGTAYEALFDPTMVDDAIEAASVLKPYTASGADAATVSDISWKSGTLKIRLDPVTAHTGHIIDFIDVDGDVALSLALSGATVDAAAKTLSWTVSSQPWKAGDKMMLRIRPAPPAPAAPAGLTAAAGNGSVTLTWNASTDSTITRYEYQVRWAGVGWGEWTAVPNSGPATASHVVTGLTNGTEYRFHLRAVNVSGAGTAAPDADPWYVKATPAAPLPAAPSGLAATAGKGSVRLTWNASTDSTITRYEYQVRWAGVGWGEWTAIPGSGSATASYVVTGLTGGTEYRFHLRAVNATGAGTVAPDAAPWYVSATPTAPSKRD